MSSTPIFDPFQAPPLDMGQQAYSVHHGHGSVGPVIGVLAIIMVLGAISVMIGRLCSGRRVMGLHGRHYDCESWVETKCASCVDGNVSPPPRFMVAESCTTSTSSGGPWPAVVVQKEAPPEKTKAETSSTHQHHQNVRS